MMSWPIWQNQNQTASNQSNLGASNVFLTPEQQYALQQQSWQQWQVYQQQLAQWQAQYGDQMSAQGIVPNVFMQNMYGGTVPPLPMEHQPPPPPPPNQDGLNVVGTDLPASQKQPTAILNPITDNSQKQLPSNETPSNFQTETSGQETFRTNMGRFNGSQNNNRGGQHTDNRNNRNWIHNNRNSNRNQNQFNNNANSSNQDNFNRSNNFPNRNDPPPTQSSSYQNLADIKSQEEIEFDEQYRKWEDQFDQWKIENQCHKDGQRYNEFVTKMEICREKMLQRREMLRQKRLKSLGISDPSVQSQQQMNASMNANIESDHGEPKPFFGSSDVGSGIPGLDLGKSEQSTMKTETNSTPIANISQILDDPNIKSLLSNIQMQQRQQQNNESNQKSENRNDRFPNNSSNQRNPFRANNFDDESCSGTKSQINDKADQSHDDRSMKREFPWKDEYGGNDENQQQFDLFQRNDRNMSRQKMQNQNKSFDAQSFRNNRKRPRNDDQSYFDESSRNVDEFRPMQVFDYQNQRQNSSQSLPTFVQQPAFTNDNRLVPDPYFPRRIIDYNHKSKKHIFQQLCPIIQMEYDHKSKAFSLHEHPPLKPREERIGVKIKNELKYSNQMNESRGGEFNQMRQQQSKWENKPKPWHQQSLQQQYQRYPNQQRFDDYRQNAINDNYQYQRSMDNQSYYGSRNQPPPERRWQSRDYDDSYNRDRYSQRTNVPSYQQTAAKTQQSSSTFIKKEPNPTKDVKDLIFPPGRRTRPQKIVIILRGPPGSGKSYIAKTIKEKESEQSNSSVRILSIDDYFMIEDENNGNSAQMIYEYDASSEDKYMQALSKSFRKTLNDRLFDIIIVDCNNINLEYLNDFYSSAIAYQYTPFICEMPLDEEKCLKNNIHNRSANDIKKSINSWVETPSTYTLLKYESLFNDADATEAISDNEDGMPGASDTLEAISDEDDQDCNDTQTNAEKSPENDEDIENAFNEFGFFKSKWDNDSTENKLARLDGTNKPMKHATIEDFLQLDGWEPPPSSSNGKKRVRWADIEEKREKDKQRAIGFVVGQTNWDNLLDQPQTDQSSSALEKIKYIEKVNNKR